MATVVRVDVGPFEDLLAMTAFEAQLNALPSMADVRVRHFATGRAEIELRPLGAVPLAREIRRIAVDAETVEGPDGTLVVDLVSGPASAERAGQRGARPDPQPPGPGADVEAAARRA
jgi:hypothetical protein